jgi:NAD(P)-dependent dehydrogenase (short-subunit alcohol dehydrogenase family)
LLEVLNANQPARIINVSSHAHVGGKIQFEDIQFKQGYAGMQAYSQSKLANVLFTYELARRLDGTAVTCNALHPGFVNTGFAKNNGAFIKLAMGLLIPFQKTVEEGARTSTYLCSSLDVEGVSGTYYVDCKPEKSDPASYDEATAAKLWQLSLDMLQ